MNSYISKFLTHTYMLMKALFKKIFDSRDTCVIFSAFGFSGLMVAQLVKESLIPAVTSPSLSFQERRRCVLESNPACFFLSTEKDIFLSQMLFSLEKGCETLALKTEVLC